MQKIGFIKVEAKNVTLVFEAGDYYIKSFEAKSLVTKQMKRGVSMSDTLTIIPNGNTRVFIDESFYISKQSLNHIDKALLINTNKNKNKIDTSYEINALIYGYSDIKLSSDSGSEFRGAIHAKGELTLGKQYSFKTGEFIYDEEAVKNLWKLSTCRVLPNEVDEELGKATLLGVDDNHNFVRNSYGCTKYLIRNDVDLIKKYKYKHADQELDKVQFNTIKRHIAYQRYNGELSGGVFKAPKHAKEKCTFDVNDIGVQ